MKRRTFLKLSSMTSASIALAGCQKSNEKLIPYLVPPEDGSTPGLADYYASTCRQCPAGCGILVRISEGRAKKIEGNPLHPINSGKLCARGQAALQELYHPDRIRHPLKRTGPRGSGQYSKISWDEAFTTLLTHLNKLQESSQTDQLALMTPPLNGSLAILTERFMRSFGSQHHVAWDLLSPEWIRRGSLASYGREIVPDYDLENTQYVLSFGADFLETHLSPVRYSKGFGSMRQARPTIRGRFTYAGARMSMTAASADRWLATRPGTEGFLALGLARELLASGKFDREAVASAGIDPKELESLLADYVPQWVVKATGVTEKTFRATANDLKTIRPALAMAGESVAWQTNGLESVKAIQLLNVLTGSIDQAGGIFLPSPTGLARQSSYAELRSFVRTMQEGKIKLALNWKSNLAFTAPATLGFNEALSNIPFLVSFSSFTDDMALHADLIMPDHSDLESWGDVMPDRGIRESVIGLLQPVVKPLHDTRPFPEVLLAAAQKIGGELAASLPWDSYPDMIKASVQSQLEGPQGEEFQQLWKKMQQQGGLFVQSGRKKQRSADKTKLPKRTTARFNGNPNDFPLHLQVYFSPTFTDGRNAHLPWLQQMPDPMSTAVWGNWVEINPATARTRGIREGDLVEVSSPVGSIRLPPVIYPGIHPDVIAIPIGQGHSNFGRYAAGRGVNPLQILTDEMDKENTLPAWGATRVQLRQVSIDGELVTAGHPDGSYRRDILGI
jgi:anaerobic selenocysteine-containing dehydrogenase